MICKNCKASIPDDSMFCPSCGHKVEAEPAVTPAPTFSSAFRQAGSLDGSDSGMGAPAAERKPVVPVGNSSLRFSSSFKRPDNISSDRVEDMHDNESTQWSAQHYGGAKFADTQKHRPTGENFVPNSDDSFANSNSGKTISQKTKRWLPISAAIGLSVIIIVIIAFFVINKTDDRRNEEQIIEDLITYELYSQDTVYDSLTISKRQTQEEKLVDTVYVTIQSHTDYTQKVESFVLVYNLYDNGWILDSVQQDWNGENNMIPLTGPGEDFVDVLFNDYNASGTSFPYVWWKVAHCEEDLAANSAIFYVDARREVTLWQTEEKITLRCTFDNGWYFANTVEDGIQSIEIDRSKLIGTYSGEDYYFDHKASLEILGVNEETGVMSIRCKFYIDGELRYNWDGDYAFTKRDSSSGWLASIECDLDGWHKLHINTSSIYFVYGTTGQICLFDSN